MFRREELSLRRDDKLASTSVCCSLLGKKWQHLSDFSVVFSLFSCWYLEVNSPCAVLRFYTLCPAWTIPCLPLNTRSMLVPSRAVLQGCHPMEERSGLFRGVCTTLERRLYILSI